MTNNIVDLSWGHPEFLKEYWEMEDDYSAFSFDIASRYSADAGLDLLRDSISNLHAEEKNFKVGSKHIIIGNGATQLIRGLLYCLGGNSVGIPRPYYHMLPTLAEIAGYQVLHSKVDEPDVAIITNRNNPDGEIVTEGYMKAPSYIHDQVYNWSQYGSIIKDVDVPIAVNSMSKAFGHPGLRVGWALVEDDGLAQDLTEFILNDTCGVSTVSQLMAVNVISKQLAKPPKKRCFYYGRYELKYRWALLKRTLGSVNGMEVLNRLGMFALLKVDAGDAYDFMLQKYGIKGIPGPQMGLAEDIIRVNMGSATTDFEQFISRLSENTIYENNQH